MKAKGEWITSATDALSQIPEATAYARVDTVVVALWVLEIEVIDPTLFFDLHPPAAIRLAEALRAFASVP